MIALHQNVANCQNTLRWRIFLHMNGSNVYDRCGYDTRQLHPSWTACRRTANLPGLAWQNTASKLSAESGETQGEESEKIFEILHFGTVMVGEGEQAREVQEKDTDFDTVVNKFNSYFLVKRNIHERTKFQGSRMTRKLLRNTIDICVRLWLIVNILIQKTRCVIYLM